MGGLVTRSNCSSRQAWRSFAGVPRGVMNALTRILVSRTALGTQCPAASTGCSCLFHGLSGIAQGLTSRHIFVLGPHPVNDSKELVPLFSQGLVPIKRHHSRHRLALFLNDQRIFFPTDPTKQRGKLVLDVFRAEGLHHWVSLLIVVLRHSVHRLRIRVQGKFGQVRNRCQVGLKVLRRASLPRHLIDHRAVAGRWNGAASSQAALARSTSWRASSGVRPSEEKGSVTVFGGVFSRTTLGAQRRGESEVFGDVVLPCGHAEGGLTVHTGAEAGEFMVEQGGVNPVVPSGRHLHRPRIEEGAMLAAGPGPLVGSANQAGAHRVAQDIPEHG